MCTLSVFRADGAIGAGGADGVLLRVVINRDEQRSRPASLPPALRRTGAQLSVFPTDPVGGGTWIGVNDAGIVAALLNATKMNLNAPRPASREGSQQGLQRSLQSRGVLVPMVLAEGTVEDAVAAIMRWDASHTAPFRLWISDGDSQRVVSSDGLMVRASGACELAAPVMLASSGLGDEIVRKSREAALARLTAASGWSVGVQDRFHEITDPRDGALGVLMSRADARTVSRTEIVFNPDAAEMRHVLLGDDLQPSGKQHMVRLELNRTRATMDQSQLVAKLDKQRAGAAT